MLDIAVYDAIDDRIQVVQYYLHGFSVLFLEDDLPLPASYLSLAVKFMQVEAIRIGAFVAPEEVGAIFGGSKRDLEWSICQFVPIE